MRWLVDRAARKQASHAHLTEEQFVEESDKSPGVLLASGYIAGGAIDNVAQVLVGAAPERVGAIIASFTFGSALAAVFT